MDNEMNTPFITSLAVGNEPPSHGKPGSTSPWKTPFLELLRLLKVIDDSKPTSKVEDHRFCFQPSHDLSGVSKIFLSVSTSSIQYDIDLKSIRLLGSNAVPTAVDKLQEYANQVLQRFQLFRNRLIEDDVITDSTCFLRVDLFTCPLCRGPLVNCVDCHSKVACSKPGCRGSTVVDCEHCYEHDRMVCCACLIKNDTVPPVIRCPACGGWCCREDVDWCAGLIIRPALGTEELAELSRECNWDMETIVRSHPPKPGPCGFCADHELASGWVKCFNSVGVSEPNRCPSQTPFMTRLHLYAAYCPQCVDQSRSHRCTCGSTWICETCSVVGNKLIPHPFLITCPRCGVNYCTHPGAPCGAYIELCRGCREAVLCKNCQGKEELTGPLRADIPEGPHQTESTLKCTSCGTWTCANCQVSERSALCFLCTRWFCHDCVRDEEHNVIKRCPFCQGHVCQDCRINHGDCPGVLMLRNALQMYLARGSC